MDLLKNLISFLLSPFTVMVEPYITFPEINYVQSITTLYIYGPFFKMISVLFILAFFYYFCIWRYFGIWRWYIAYIRFFTGMKDMDDSKESLYGIIFSASITWFSGLFDFLADIDDYVTPYYFKRNLAMQEYMKTYFKNKEDFEVFKEFMLLHQKLHYEKIKQKSFDEHNLDVSTRFTAGHFFGVEPSLQFLEQERLNSSYTCYYNLLYFHDYLYLELELKRLFRDAIYDLFPNKKLVETSKDMDDLVEVFFQNYLYEYVPYKAFWIPAAASANMRIRNAEFPTATQSMFNSIPLERLIHSCHANKIKLNSSYFFMGAHPWEHPAKYDVDESDTWLENSDKLPFKEYYKHFFQNELATEWNIKLALEYQKNLSYTDFLYNQGLYSARIYNREKSWMNKPRIKRWLMKLEDRLTTVDVATAPRRRLPIKRFFPHPPKKPRKRGKLKRISTIKRFLRWFETATSVKREEKPKRHFFRRKTEKSRKKKKKNRYGLWSPKRGMNLNPLLKSQKFFYNKFSHQIRDRWNYDIFHPYVPLFYPFGYRVGDQIIHASSVGIPKRVLAYLMRAYARWYYGPNWRNIRYDRNMNPTEFTYYIAERQFKRRRKTQSVAASAERAANRRRKKNYVFMRSYLDRLVSFLVLSGSAMFSYKLPFIEKFYRRELNVNARVWPEDEMYFHSGESPHNYDLIRQDIINYFFYVHKRVYVDYCYQAAFPVDEMYKNYWPGATETVLRHKETKFNVDYLEPYTSDYVVLNRAYSNYLSKEEQNNEPPCEIVEKNELLTVPDQYHWYSDYAFDAASNGGGPENLLSMLINAVTLKPCSTIFGILAMCVYIYFIYKVKKF